MKSRVLLIVSIICSILLVCLGYFYFCWKLPEKTVVTYINARYANVSSANIKECIQMQKALLDDSLITPNYMFGSFIDNIKYFQQNDLRTTLLDINIQDRHSINDKVYINALVKVKYEFGNANLPNQNMHYEMKFILEKYKWNKYKIGYIKCITQHSQQFNSDPNLSK